MNHKKLLKGLLVCGLLFMAKGAFAQQITRFAVIDTARVYQAYFRNSSSVRNYENKKGDYQNEIDGLTKELEVLHDKKLEYERNGDSASAAALASEISQKTDYIKEYAAAKNAELDSLKASLEDNDEFYENLYATIEKIAESGGYSVVMSLQQANAILWYSPSVDITDDVITQLGL
ncbi:MAG: OmpH family outer membrane protein [Treponema sp.]|nr:OmpH family outer membrane protein [Treponema sp.]